MSNLFGIIPPIIKRFEEQGYARCGYSKRRTGFKSVSKGDIYEVAKLTHDDRKKEFYLYLKGVNGKYKVYFFKPATRKQYEKHKMMEKLG